MMKIFLLFLLSIINIPVNAGPEDMARELFEKQPVFPASAAEIDKSVDNMVPGYADSKNSSEMQNLSSMFGENVDTGKREGDSIGSELGARVKEHNRSHKEKNNAEPSISEVETLLGKKHHYRIPKTDSVLMGYKKVQEGSEGDAYAILDKVKNKLDPNFSERPIDSIEETEKILNCREAGHGIVESCTKRLILTAIPQEPLVKTVTAYFTARCYNLVTFVIDLKTGGISVSQCENQGPVNTRVDNPMGEPDYPDRTTIQLLSQQHYGEGGVDFRAGGMTPTAANGFSVHFTAFQPKTGRKKKHNANKNTVRGGQYSWKITMPRKPKLVAKWEGCEDLKRKAEDGACTLEESFQQGIQESRKVEGYPDLVKQDFWQVDRNYACGFGSNQNECEKLVQQGCEQIDSKCAIEKSGYCIEYERKFRCAVGGFHGPLRTPKVEGSDFSKGQIQPGFEGYNAADFGYAMTHFSALKEMSNEMKDGLGGIGGTAENPTIFHGKCDRCTIKGGKMIQDCCNLKGLLQGILGGGCRESEKLATAVLREKRCHLVQKKYCTHQIKLGFTKICIEWKDAYCCYGSELARIIQEIAHDDPNQTELRTYNAAHGIDSGWGTGDNPNCHSLSAEQLSLINFDTTFAQKHLGQLFKEFESKAEAKFKEVENRAASSKGMKSRAERAQESMSSHFSSSFKDRPNSRFRGNEK